MDRSVHSQAVALAAVRDLRTASLTELAAATGLSRPTLASALDSIAPTGLVTVAPGEPSGGERIGRPARFHSFDGGAGLVASVDLSRVEGVLGLTDLHGHLVARSTTPWLSPTTEHPGLEPVAQALDTALASIGATRDQVRALCCAVTGVVDDGVVFRSPSVRSWRNLDLASELGALLGVPVHVENDLVLAATAEARQGALTDADCGVYVLTWHHVSSRISINGRVLRGRRNQAGEMGLLRNFVDPARQPGHLLEEMAATASDLERLHTDPTDTVGPRALTTLVEAMAPAVAALLLAVDPDVIVLGGPLGRYSDLLAPRLAEHLLTVTAGRELDAPIVGSALGPDAVLAGGFLAAFEQFSTQTYGIPGVRAPHLDLTKGTVTP